MAGLYTEIVEIIVPPEAAAGDLVEVEVRVRNAWGGYLYIGVSGSADGIEPVFSPDNVYVAPGGIASFTASFTMPEHYVFVNVWSWVWIEYWYQDDYAYALIDLTVIELFTGTISRKELEHDSTRSAIPVY